MPHDRIRGTLDLLQGFTKTVEVTPYGVRHIQCPTCLQVVGKTLTIPSLRRPGGPKQRNAPRRLLGRSLSL